MSAVAAPVAMRRALPPEESAWANFYALLGRLLRAPPDAALIAALATSEPLPADGDVAIAAAWRNLIDASSAMDAEAAATEYEALFDGVGKAEVSIYAGFYSGAPSIDHPRVRLQADIDGPFLEGAERPLHRPRRLLEACGDERCDARRNRRRL